MTLTQITEKGIKDGEIINADINASAAIAKSKLASLEIVNSDINASAAIAGTKISPNFGSQSMTTTGNIKTSADVHGSGGVIAAGASDDLSLWHDGTNSYIRNTANAGELRIRSHQTTIRNADDNETQAIFHENGAVELYYDNSKKIETTSTGVDITGDLIIDGAAGGTLTLGGSSAHTSKLVIASNDGSSNGNLLVEGGDGGDFFTINSAGNVKFEDNKKAEFGGGGDLQIYHDGNSRIDHNGSGVLVIRTQGANEDIQLLSARDILLRPQGGENGININGNGSVEIYYDDSKKFETNSGGVDITGDLHVKAPDGGNIAYFDTTLGGRGLKINTFTSGNAASAGVNFEAPAGAGKSMFTFSGASEFMRINPSGQVAIGTTTPGDANLAIKGTTNAYGGVGNSTTLVGAKLLLEDDQGRKVSFWAPRSGEGAIGSITNHDFVVVTGNAEKARFTNSTGNFELASGNLVIGTSGKGIHFGATADGSGSNQDELLDDYETGNWVPTFPNNGTGNQALGTYLAEYVKIGRFVYAFMYANITGAPQNSATTWVIGGLPFTTKYSNLYHHGTGNVTYVGSNSYSQWRPLVTINSTVYFHRTDGSNAVLKNNDVVSEGMGYWIMGLNYMTSQ